MLFLLSSGSNSQGQLGTGSDDDSHTFQQCSFANHPSGTLPSGTSRILDVATGANHTVLILEMFGNRRELWGCGDGRKGQLGSDYRQQMAAGCSTTLFRKLDLSLEDCGLGGYSFKFIAATWETTYVVLSREGERDVVMSMGSDDYGDLGVGGLKEKKSFHLVSFDHLSALSEGFIVRALYSGQRHIILHIESNLSSTLVGWGASRHGQLGVLANKPFASSPVAVSISAGTSILDDAIQSVSLGMQHSVISRTSGLHSGLGSNRKGQLEVVMALTSDRLHIWGVGCTWNGTYVVTENNQGWSVRSSGSNSHCQLGWSPNGSAKVGTVGFPDTIDARNTTVEIQCGSEHVLALITSEASQRQVWGWGWNEHGNLGVGNTVDIPVPTKIWPPLNSSENPFHVHGIWAGLGTSWICSDIPDGLH